MTLVGRFRRSMPASEPAGDNSSSDETSQASATGGVGATDGSEKVLEKGTAANLDKAEKGDTASVDVIAVQQQTDGEITYRTMSWQKCAAREWEDTQFLAA